MTHDETPSPVGRTTLGELAWVFAKLGVTAFGGPAAHNAMMEDEVVRRRGWLSREQFLDMVGATNLISENIVDIDLPAQTGDHFAIWGSRLSAPVATGDGPMFLASILNEVTGTFE